MFDMDGTLIDSIHGWVVSYKKFLKQENLQETLELFKMLDGKKLIKKCEIIKEYFNLPLSQMEIYKRCLVFVKEGYDNDFKAKDGVIESLEYLKDKGYKISLNTATKMEVCKGALERLNLLKYFDYIQTCKECGFLKEDERFYEISIKRHGENASDILFFDDNILPLETAKKLGIKTCLVFDEITCKNYFDSFELSDFKLNKISIDSLKSIGL